jgi:hypothetical protein
MMGDGVTHGIVRIRDTVRRPVRPFTATIQAYLAHLHQAGFTAAPVPLGIDEQGREMLSFVPGDIPREPLPAETAGENVLVALAQLIHRLHDAAQGRVPRTVLIDFDLARPTTRLYDIANALYWWVPLLDPRERAPAFTDLDASHRVAIFADADGMTAQQRKELVPLATRMVHRFHLTARAAADVDPVFRRFWEKASRTGCPGPKHGKHADPAIAAWLTATVPHKYT